MAAEDDKTDKKKLEITTKGPLDVINACEISLKDIIVQLHVKAQEKAVEKGPDYTILNSAIDGEGKDATFYGAGTHIIAAIPKKNSGLDKNTIPKDIALAMLQEYVLWFVGPDLKTALTEKDLIPLENENSGTTEDTSKKRSDIEKSRGSDKNSEKVSTASKEKYKESVEVQKVPSFYSYLFEDGEGSDSEDTRDDSGDSEDAENKDSSTKGDDTEDTSEETDEASIDSASGYYIAYKMHIDGLTDHPLADALKKFAKDLFSGFGFKVGSWRTGAMGDAHTIGGLLDGLDAVFGKIDAKELEANYVEEIRKAAPDSDASVKVIDTKTIVKHLKKHLSGQDIKAIKGAELAVCTKVNKQDKSYKLYDRQFVADKITRAIKGLYKKFKNAIKKDSVILVNNYEENKKERGEVKYTEKGEGAVKDSLNTSYSGHLIYEALKSFDEKREELEKELKDLAKGLLDDENYVDAFVKAADDAITLLKDAGINNADLFHSINVAKNAFIILTKNVSKPVNASLKSSADLFTTMLFEKSGESGPKIQNLKPIILNIFKELVYKYAEEWLGNESPKTEAIDHIEPLLVNSKDISESQKAKLQTEFMSKIFEDLDNFSVNEDSEMQFLLEEDSFDKVISLLSKQLQISLVDFIKANSKLKLYYNPIAGCESSEKIKDALSAKGLLSPDAEKILDTSKYAFYFITKKKSIDEDGEMHYGSPGTSLFNKSIVKSQFDSFDKIKVNDMLFFNKTANEKLCYNKTKVPANCDVYIGTFDEIPGENKSVTLTISAYWVLADENGILKNMKIVFVTPDPNDPDNKKKWKVLEDQEMYDDVAKVVYPDIEKIKINDDPATEWDPPEDRLSEVYDNQDEKYIFEYDKKNCFAIKALKSKEQSSANLRLKFVDLDPEDPDNTGSWSDIGEISVRDGMYKADELREKSKDETNKTKAKEYLDTAKKNQETFKKVTNIAEFDKKHKPYKFLGWTPDINLGEEDPQPLKTIEEIIDACSSKEMTDDDEPIAVKPVYSNDIKSHHSELDFYIVPMPGLKIKDKSSSEK